MSLAEDLAGAWEPCIRQLEKHLDPKEGLRRGRPPPSHVLTYLRAISMHQPQGKWETAYQTSVCRSILSAPSTDAYRAYTRCRALPTALGRKQPIKWIKMHPLGRPTSSWELSHSNTATVLRGPTTCQILWCTWQNLFLYRTHFAKASQCYFWKSGLYPVKWTLSPPRDPSCWRSG